MAQLNVFSDGACIGNGRASAVGGIGVWFGHGDPRNIAKGYGRNAGFIVTNHKMELLAAIHALRAAQGSPVCLYTDSMYVINCVTKWIKGWMKNGWRTASGGPVLNRELIEELAGLYEACGARILHVPSHTRAPPRGTPAFALWEGNDQADKLATSAVPGFRPRKRGQVIDIDV